MSIDGNKHFEVFAKDEIGLSKGDKIRITHNGIDANKEGLDNGQIMEVLSVNKKGHIQLRNVISTSSYKIDKEYGHIAHAHCITSHASQGKTVDEVVIAQPASTFPATDIKQFYVSVSHGGKRVRIYTDDKQALLEHASHIRDRQSAIELVGVKNATQKAAEQLSREEMQKNPHLNIKTKSAVKSEPINSRYHEPEIFKLKYEELREGNPANQPDENAVTNSETKNQNYNRPGNIRNLCFAWTDGRKLFLNYAYLVSGEFNVKNETNVITLTFTSHNVTLKGYNFEDLFLTLISQIPSLITQIHPRYTFIQNDKELVIVEISIEHSG